VVFLFKAQIAPLVVTICGMTIKESAQSVVVPSVVRFAEKTAVWLPSTTSINATTTANLIYYSKVSRENNILYSSF
jgi:hypothetical protein